MSLIRPLSSESALAHSLHAPGLRAYGPARLRAGRPGSRPPDHRRSYQCRRTAIGSIGSRARLCSRRGRPAVAGSYMADQAASPRPEAVRLQQRAVLPVSELLVDEENIEPVGIVEVAGPGAHLDILGMSRVAEDARHAVVAGNAAAVLVGEASLPGQTDRVWGRLVDRDR
jgi:hypothetical protein